MLIAMFVVAILIEIGLPFVVGRWSVRRFGFGWRFFWVGALTFILSQVGHIPFLQWVTGLFMRGVLPNPSPAFAPWFNAIFLGLAAGVFEETARLIAFWVMRRRATGWGSAVTMGAGHGGVESILVGVSVLANVVLVLLVSQGMGGILPPALAQQVQAGVGEFFGQPWYIPLIGAVERVTAITLHIFLSVLVWLSLARRNALYFFAALLYHALVDALAVRRMSFGLDIIGLEALLVALTALHIFLLVRIGRSERARENRLAGEQIERAI